MQAWLAPVVGTLLGLGLAGVGAALVLPERPVIDIGPLVRAVVLPKPAVVAAPVAVPVPVPAVVAPVVAAPVVARPRPMPEPLPPPLPEPAVGIDGLLRRPPAGVSSGTGFFVTSRGTLLTAEHVVRGCRGVRVLSSYMRPAAARVLAVDVPNDVAVLEVSGGETPGWLPVGAPSRGAGRLLALGFPAGALPDVPNETWARLSNAAFAPGVPVETDPGRLVWFHSREVTYGYSGGPVVDVANGRAVALTRGGFDPTLVADVHGVSAQGLHIGPGAGPLLALLSQWAVREGVAPVVMGVEGALEMARRATVQVVCAK
jgi:serine protease Do